MSLTLSPGQEKCVEQACHWFRHDSAHQQVFRIFGPAGTGKTTLATLIVNELGLRDDEVFFCAFTGKAAYRLAEKGCPSPVTIHKLIYIPVQKARGRLEELRKAWEKADGEEEKNLARAIAEEEANLTQPGFTLNLDSAIRGAKLCIVDEVSMVDERMANDLMSFGVALLVLGDPAQLPPVRGSGWFMEDEPDVLLDENHRFGDESSVLKVATAVRYGEGRDLGVTGILDGDDDGPASGRWNKKLTIEQALRFDVVLCWRNDTRWRINRMIRKARGFSGSSPGVGEKIIMLANNYDLGVFNGQELMTQTCEAGKIDGMLDIHAVDPWGEGRGYRLPVVAGGFEGKKQQEEAERAVRGKNIGLMAVATFAHAITTHKYQGSEAKKVLVLDETNGVRYMSGEVMARKWLYTAVTRASEQVIIAPGIE